MWSPSFAQQTLSVRSKRADYLRPRDRLATRSGWQVLSSGWQFVIDDDCGMRPPVRISDIAMATTQAASAARHGGGRW
jgi:hypothetical protein